MNNYDLGNRIYELRKAMGLSQKELGEMLGISNKSVSKWENGATVPKTETLVRLAEILGVSPEELLQGKTDDKQTLSKLSAQANQYFLKEELDKRDKMEKSYQVISHKRYLIIILTLFTTTLVVNIILSFVGFLEFGEDGGTIITRLLDCLVLSYLLSGFFTGIVLLIRNIKKFNTIHIIILCVFFPFTILAFIVLGIIFVIPQIIHSVKMIMEDKYGK